jgi:hypothetical protein
MSIASKTPMDCMKVQAQIRANATEMQDYYSELSQWEKAMEKKDREVRGKRKGAQVGLAHHGLACHTTAA